MEPNSNGEIIAVNCVDTTDETDDKRHFPQFWIQDEVK